MPILPSAARGLFAAATLEDVNAIRIGLADADDAVRQNRFSAHPVMPESIPILSERSNRLPTSARIAALESLSTGDASANWKTIANCLKGSTSERYPASLRALAAMKAAASASAISPMLQDASGIVRRGKRSSRLSQKPLWCVEVSSRWRCVC